MNAAAWSWVERIECRAITLYLKVKIIVLSKSFSLEDTAKNNKIYLQIGSNLKNVLLWKILNTHKSSENNIYILIDEKKFNMNYMNVGFKEF